MDILHTLQTLNACHGPSGDEREIADAIQKLAAPYVYEGQSPAPEYRICLDLQGEDADKIARWCLPWRMP